MTVTVSSVFAPGPAPRGARRTCIRVSVHYPCVCTCRQFQLRLRRCARTNKRPLLLSRPWTNPTAGRPENGPDVLVKRLSGYELLVSAGVKGERWSQLPRPGERNVGKGHTRATCSGIGYHRQPSELRPGLRHPLPWRCSRRWAWCCLVPLDGSDHVLFKYHSLLSDVATVPMLVSV